MAASDMTVARTFIRTTIRTNAATTAALDQSLLQVADRGFDESHLPELDVSRRDSGRQRLLDNLQCGLICLVIATVSVPGCF